MAASLYSTSWHGGAEERGGGRVTAARALSKGLCKNQCPPARQCGAVIAQGTGH